MLCGQHMIRIVVRNTEMQMLMNFMSQTLCSNAKHEICMGVATYLFVCLGSKLIATHQLWKEACTKRGFLKCVCELTLLYTWLDTDKCFVFVDVYVFVLWWRYNDVHCLCTRVCFAWTYYQCYSLRRLQYGSWHREHVVWTGLLNIIVCDNCSVNNYIIDIRFLAYVVVCALHNVLTQWWMCKSNIVFTTCDWFCVAARAWMNSERFYVFPTCTMQQPIITMAYFRCQ